MNIKKIILFVGIFLAIGYIYTTYYGDKSLTSGDDVMDVLAPEETDEIIQAVADAGVELEEGDVVVDEGSGEPFTVIQGGGFPTGGMGGLYRPEGYNNPRPRALGDLGVRRISRQAMEGFEGAIPRALGNLGADRTTQVAMDVEGVDKL